MFRRKIVVRSVAAFVLSLLSGVATTKSNDWVGKVSVSEGTDLGQGVIGRIDESGFGDQWPLTLSEPALWCMDSGVIAVEDDSHGRMFAVAMPGLAKIGNIDVKPLTDVLKEGHVVDSVEHELLQLGEKLCDRRKVALPGSVLTPERVDGDWPFSVDRIAIKCVEPAALFGVSGNALYPLNGMAQSKGRQFEAVSLSEIQVPGMMISNVIAAGRKICGWDN